MLNDGKIDGEVYYIAPKAESSVSSLGVEQQRVEIRLRYDNGTLNLRPGYGLDVDIITDERQSTLYVPGKAVFDMNGKDCVFIVNDGKLVLRQVAKGIENNDYIEITKGISEGDIVVVDPGNSLKPGARVKQER